MITGMHLIILTMNLNIKEFAENLVWITKLHGVDDGFGNLCRLYSSKGLIGSGVYNSSMIFDEDSYVSRYGSYKASFRSFIAKFQQDFPDYYWDQFTLDISSGFTKAGILRIDSSIKTYVYCILGAQAQTRRILENTTGLESQQQFNSYVEDSIDSVVDIPSEVLRYQKALDQAGSKLDFVFGLTSTWLLVI